MPKRVLVVGAGPAGLAAAHAARGMGCGVRIVAPKRKTPQLGPLLLQRPIPGINTDHPDGYIRQIVVGGTILDYRAKMYGDINISINGDILADGYHAWHFGETYDKLWDTYEEYIWDRYLGKDELIHLERSGYCPTFMGTDERADLVVSTANAQSFCYHRDNCNFRGVRVQITPGAIVPTQPDDTIIFNADPREPWSRSSRIFGNEVTEWADPAPEELFPRWITKPISTDCRCYPRVLRTGRFGKWQNETWVDTAYYDVRSALVEMDRTAKWSSVKGELEK